MDIATEYLKKYIWRNIVDNKNGFTVLKFLYIFIWTDVPIVNYPEADPSEAQSTTEMFKDMLNQKRNLLFSKLTSFDSDVSI